MLDLEFDEARKQINTRIDAWFELLKFTTKDWPGQVKLNLVVDERELYLGISHRHGGSGSEDTCFSARVHYPEPVGG